MSTTVHLPCDSCGDDVTALAEYLTPVTLCGSCTPDQWDGASLPAEEIHADFMLDLLNESCGPLLIDDVAEGLRNLYIGNAQTWDDLLTEEMRVSPDELAELESRVPTVAMERAVAAELRARIRREAA